MRRLLIALGVSTVLFGSVVGASFAQAQTSPSNCKTIEGPGFFSQACGDNAQVSGGPGGSSASTGPEQLTTVLPSPSPTPTPAPTPAETFTPVPALVQPTPTATPPAQRPAPLGLIGTLLRLLGLG
jgi:hypothetical protein